MTSQTSGIKNQITIIGGGPVGSLLSIYLAKKGYSVDVYEKRHDLRLTQKTEGKSINLALSHRGLKALHEVGLDEKIKSIAIPMKGRMVHNEKGELNFQPYGEEGQFINSVSRNELNKILIEKAEKDHKVNYHFNTHCESIDPGDFKIEFSSGEKKFIVQPEVLLGADGAFSAVRTSFKNFKDFTFEQEFLSHGYKELHIPASASGKHLMEKHALHIWPREQFMLIALPNTDGSFTSTLFLPLKGVNSFENIKDEKALFDFFEKYFPDALPLIPALKEDFFALPASSLVTVHCFPWTYKGKAALIGDAAHAITPFYGQGMNAGFEDCRILNKILEKNNGDWLNIFSEYQKQRKTNADAIAELSLKNFIEMRDLVADKEFILRKKIEAKIHKNHPAYLPLYSMVTFSDLPYIEALQKGQGYDRMMKEIMSLKNIAEEWESKEAWTKIESIVAKYL